MEGQTCWFPPFKLSLWSLALESNPLKNINVDQKVSPFIDKAPGNKWLHKVTYAFNYLFICLTPQLDSHKSFEGG